VGGVSVLRGRVDFIAATVGFLILMVRHHPSHEICKEEAAEGGANGDAALFWGDFPDLKRGRQLNVLAF
jgi:hypothetical protein